jgi:regulator of replication initiation timing
MSQALPEPSTQDFERQFFPAAEVVTLTLPLLKESYDEMVALIERNGWELEKGFRILLAQGYAYAKGEILLQADEETAQRMLQNLLERESTYAVLKFETFHLMRDNQTLEMREAALRNAVSGLEQAVSRLRRENETLRAEVQRLQGETRLGQEGASSERPASPQARRKGPFCSLLQKLGWRGPSSPVRLSSGKPGSG